MLRNLRLAVPVLFSGGNTFSNPNSVAFDGVDVAVTGGSGATIDNVFAGGATILMRFYPETVGGGSQARLFSKTAMSAFILQASGSVCNIWLAQQHSSANGSWSFGVRPVNLNAWNTAQLEYNSDDNSNDPIGIINGTTETPTEQNTPSGTPTSDASDTLYLGNVSALDRAFDGYYHEFAIFKATGITGLYNGGKSFDLSTHPNFSDCVMWLRFGNGNDAYPTLYDYAGSNDGTMVNMSADDIVAVTPNG